LPALKIGEDGFENVQPGLAGPQAIFPQKLTEQAGLFLSYQGNITDPHPGVGGGYPVHKAGNPFGRHGPRNISPL
jgi:hypothetical protein